MLSCLSWVLRDPTSSSWLQCLSAKRYISSIRREAASSQFCSSSFLAKDIVLKPYRNQSVKSLPVTSAIFTSSFVMKRCIPFEISEIPLTGFPLAESIKLSVEHVSTLSTQKADLLVVAVQSPIDFSTREAKVSDDSNTDESKKLVSISPMVDSVVNGEFNRLVSRSEFTGAEGKTAIARLPDGFPFENIGLVGVGIGLPDQSTILRGYDIKKGASSLPLSSFIASKLGKPLATLTSSVKAKSVFLHVDSSAFDPLSVQSLIESFLISSASDERFKSQSAEPCHLESLTLLVNPDDMIAYMAALQNAREIAKGIQLAKELTATPPNYCNPESLAKTALQLARAVGLESRVLGRDDCVARGMGAYLAVNQGSIYEPQFIHLTYIPEGGSKRKIAFIGKGISMDTGGYNLKTQGGIETMKMDMGGAAAVFGAAHIIGSLKPQNIEVHFIVAAAENMIDGASYRPGDIVTASNGKTIEVLNTDAEGRLTLADALIYAENEVQPDAILDCATLTGACVAALGVNIAAVYSQDDKWMSTVLRSAKTAGSPLWPMPLFSDYKKLNESKLADISNLPTVRLGGSIHAALFLREFIKNTPWAHIDLAGPVYDPSTKEFTGYGAKLLAQIVFDSQTSM